MKLVSNIQAGISRVQLAYANNKIAKQAISQRTIAAVGMAALLVAMAVSPETAMAEPWDSTAQKVLEIFTGGLARTLAIIAVIACGIMALGGKLSWDWAIKIIIGLVLIFGSTAFIDYIVSATGG